MGDSLKLGGGEKSVRKFGQGARHRYFLANFGDVWIGRVVACLPLPCQLIAVRHDHAQSACVSSSSLPMDSSIDHG